MMRYERRDGFYSKIRKVSWECRKKKGMFMYIKIHREVYAIWVASEL